jgi:RimJ/RimL family protein N-acetyltransferase
LGKGYGTEVNRVLDFGFNDLNLHRIKAGCAVENIASIKVLEKVGMIREGRGRQLLPLKLVGQTIFNMLFWKRMTEKNFKLKLNTKFRNVIYFFTYFN